jgi:hypothetical protein
MKNGGNGLDRVAVLKLFGEWMIDQYYARLGFVVSQGSLKEHL